MKLKIFAKLISVVIFLGLISCSEKKSTSTTTWKKNIDYVYFGEDCRSTSSNQCISFSEYESACKAAKGVTNHAIKIRGVNSIGPEKILIDGGSIKNIDVYWGKSSRGLVCGVAVTMNGIVNGNSTSLEVSGTATSFVVDDAGDLLVSGFNNY